MSNDQTAEALLIDAVGFIVKIDENGAPVGVELQLVPRVVLYPDGETTATDDHVRAFAPSFMFSPNGLAALIKAIESVGQLIDLERIVAEADMKLNDEGNTDG